MEERRGRRSSRVPKPVLKQEDVKMAEEAIDNALKRKSRGNRKVEEGSTSSSSGDANVDSNSQVNKKRKRASSSSSSTRKDEKKLKREAQETEECKLVGDQIPSEEARERWPDRYDSEIIQKKLEEITKKGSNEEILIVKCHYSAAEVDGTTYHLNDNAIVKSDKPLPFICKIVEFFRTSEGQVYFTAQWYYRASDTVIEKGPMQSDLIDTKRVFFSEVKDDNPLECLLGKPKISMIAHNVDRATKDDTIADSDFFCDMLYQLPYNTFISVPPANIREAGDVSSGLSSGSDRAAGGSKDSCTAGPSSKSELSMLDLYAGCGAMSTGLCLGAKVGEVNLVTRWALDLNESACKSLALNHPETKVINDCGENFLSLLVEWEKLCHQYELLGTPSECIGDDSRYNEDCEASEFEVEEIVGISFGNPADLDKVKKSSGKGSRNATIPKGTELYFKVHWKGFNTRDDTWEPCKNLSNCEEIIKKFVTSGYKSNLLPLPGDVDVICGGPPCQGISGYNLFRNVDNPLDDEKNYQMVVYMDIVKFLKPQYILMENVVDLLKFSNGFLARHAVSRLISMDYQVRMGIMAAGSFGLPQFRQRVFLWGAQLRTKLPPYPLPTHEAVVRGGLPNDFERCLVAYDDISKQNLDKALLLSHALMDLPQVANDAMCDAIPYEQDPLNGFQQYMRLNKTGEGQIEELYDHLPLRLNKDDYERVCKIPKQKEAFFRDLGGVIVNEEGKWALDPNKPREYLESGKPLVPNYALTFNSGTSKKPFGRLWWDETVPTVVTRAEPHNQVITHPEQDRVLTIRENARLQGFPDHYRLCGDVRDKYTQVGNAVAVPVGKALGFALALSVRGLCDGGPLVELPANFSFAIGPLPPPVVEHNEEEESSDLVH